jgi:hypothetical protein
MRAARRRSYGVSPCMRARARSRRGGQRVSRPHASRRARVETGRKRKYPRRGNGKGRSASCGARGGGARTHIVGLAGVRHRGRSRSCAAGREGARRARARSVVARGNSPRNIVSSQEKPSSVITRASCVRSPSRPECGLAPPEYERATRRARVRSERCPRRTPDTREVEPKQASRVSKERSS